MLYSGVVYGGRVSLLKTVGPEQEQSTEKHLRKQPDFTSDNFVNALQYYFDLLRLVYFVCISSRSLCIYFVFWYLQSTSRKALHLASELSLKSFFT